MMGSIKEFGFPDYIKKLDAAVIFGKRRNTYFFAGHYYWRFNERFRTFDKGYPKKIRAIWKGAPIYMDAALTWRNGVTYFFKGNRLSVSSKTIPQGTIIVYKTLPQDKTGSQKPL